MTLPLSGNEIAIIGMAARFPGAPDLATFWRNLRAGVESISFFADDELETSPLVPEQARAHPGFVPAGGVLDGAELFDHDLFGIPRREARWMDPQQRVFAQLAWTALEDAGYDPGRFAGRISVYAGAGSSGHQLALLSRLGTDPASAYEALGSAAAQNLATKVSFLLGLRGESMNVHTACSTGLATVHMACQSLLLEQSGMAIAGAVSLSEPQRTGYVHQEGMILSPDGHCRAFDHRAAGTVPGHGAGVVVLKPLADALADRDHVYAVIRGSAINNEGHRSVGYTAPSVAAQAEVVAEALAFADTSAADIGYVEAHGTGTPLGDPIEIAALTRAFRRTTDRVADCPIGSVKTNVGHLDTAAGIAGLIKVALMVGHGELPASLHLESPNPAIDFAASPFTVNTESRPWPSGPRVAGVSSFGIGGTNVHAVVTEPPPAAEPAPSHRQHQLVTVSAHTEAALSTMVDDLARVDDVPLADLAYTRAVGRTGLRYRRAYVVAGLDELSEAARPATPVGDRPRVGFLFPGNGAAVHGMAGELYRAEPAFRDALDACLAELEPRLGRPLLPLLLEGTGPIDDPELAHPALFAVEHALATVLMSWGVTPAAFAGHSFGEYAAACLAGVLPLADAAELTVARGRLVRALPEGAMLAVGLDEPALAPYLSEPVALAAVNGDDRCVVSGPVDAIASLRERLAADGHTCRPLPVRRAFHSPAVEPALPGLTAVAGGLSRTAPTVPLLSGVSGSWWTGDDGDPSYWATQMREPVRFAATLETLAAGGTDPLVLVEVGPGHDLTAFARARLRRRATVVPALPLTGRAAGHRGLLTALGALWCAGVELDWDAFYRTESRRRVPLPGYPFEGVDCRLDVPIPPPVNSTVDVPAAEVAADGVERTVLRIWQERLGTEDVGRHDSFLELGGNSLTAAQLITRLRAAFSVDLPLALLFEEPTVAGLATRIRTLLGSGAQAVPSLPADELPPIRPVPGERPLSVVQRRTLALEAADPGNPALAMPVAVRIEGQVDADALERAVNSVVARHETLRAAFSGPEWTQRIRPEAPVTLVVESGAGEEWAARRAREEACEPFDLTRTPLRARLLRLADADHILLITLHHVVSDTLSMVNLVGEVATHYAAAVAGHVARLAELAVQYPDFAAWQREQLDGDALERQRDYWRERLADRPAPPALPTDRPRTAAGGVRGRHVDLTLPRGLSDRVTAVGRRLGATPFVTLLAAYTALLGRLADAEDLVVGTPVGNRGRAELEPLIGYVAHALPLRADLSGDPTFAELVARTRRTALAAHANADVPYEELAAELEPDKDIGRSRVFDAMFVMHAEIQEDRVVAGGTWRLWRVPDMPAMFAATLAEVSLMLAETPAGFTGTLTYAEELFDSDTARQLGDRFTALLTDAVRRPDLPLSALRLELAAEPEEEKAPLAFSLSFFATDEDALTGSKYELLLAAARLADERGLTAIWTPERHFHPFGGLFPSPTATGAALATATRRIGIRAGSVVLPLHDPIRVAEDWSVIDNLSDGRVGVSFASGWHPDDFVLFPDRYADRRERMGTDIETVTRLWRGKTVRRRNGVGDEVEIAIRPRPVQAELPFWLTAAGNPETFREAGRLGAFILTNLMAQSLDDLAGKVKLYREAWRAAGHDGDGHVTLMLHTFLADDPDAALAQAREPLLSYFRSSVDIARGFAASQGLTIRPGELSEEDMATLLEHGLERYLRDGALVGTPESCVPVVERVRVLGVDEIAALIDFGVPVPETLRSVELLAELADREPAQSAAVPASAPASLSDEPLRPVPRERPLPLSFAQQRLWYLDQLVPGDVAYNNAVALRMRGALDVAALHDALRAVVDRHEVLRTTFETTVDGPIQIVHSGLEVHLPVREAAAGDVARLATEFAREPFGLTYGPLLRARLLRISAEEHVLLLCLHHIVSDGWSAGVLCGELGALYAAFTTGGPNPLPPLPVQYGDYAVWQRNRQHSPTIAAELDYWTGALAGVATLELPVDRQRGRVQSRRGTRASVRVPRELADAVHALCRQTGSTPYMVLHAGFASVLHRYSGQTDLAIGTAVAGRNHPETESLVGCFINSVVVRADLSGDPAFRELLDRVKRATLGAVAHQEVPFERLVDALNVPRTLSHAPLFQAMLVLHNTPNPTVRLGGLTLEPLEIDPRAAKLDLVLELREDVDGIGGWWEYNTDLFEPATIEGLTRHLLALLADAVTNPDRTLSRLALLSEEERGRVLALSTGTPLDGDEDVVHAAFEAQVARTPDALAVGDERRPLTYRELDEAANRIAHGLRARGVGPGTRVALLTDEPVEAIPAMLGVLKAGGAYVPIDPRAPKARVAGLLEAAEPVVVVDDPAALAAGQPASPPTPSATPTDPAYVMFTSGSTGRPKGVVVEHRQLLTTTRARHAQYGEPGRCFNLFALHFDGSVGWIYFALLYGGNIWCPPADIATEPFEIVELVARVRPERLATVPALYGQLLATGGRLDVSRTVTVGGETCLPELARAHAAALPETELYNEYGPTEATVWSTVHRVAGPVGDRVPIGRPIAGATNYVLDTHGRPLPVGGTGELHLGGPAVAAGYLGDADLTRRRFVPDRLGGTGRLYRTGDRVRWNQRGELEFLGRMDRQVKVRGFRVEPAEIEAVLVTHPEVVDAAVVPVDGRLVACVAPDMAVDELRAYTRERLPDYLVPAHFVAVAALPRARNGKIDLAALPVAAAPAEEFVEPRTEPERVVAGVVSEVLNRRIGVHDDFFASGGDSILAMSVVTRLRQRSIELTVRELFENPTVAGVAAVGRPAVRALPATATGEVPLTPVQRWFFGQHLAEPAHWNMSVHVELDEPPRRDLLESAFRAVVAHHDAPRLRFRRVDGEWRQHVIADADWTFDDEPVDRLHQTLDLADGPLLRAALDDRHLVVVAHHLVTDGVSWRVLLGDALTAYRALAAGGPVDLPPGTPYAEWARRLPEFFAGPRGRAELDYWASVPFAGAPRLPRDGDAPNVHSGAAAVRIELDERDTARLPDVETAVLTAVATAVSGWTGADAVQLDVERHGREDLVPGLDVARTVGWFSDFHPLLVRVDASSPAARLAAVRSQVRAVPNRGAGYVPLRYGAGELADVPPSELSVNYLGRLDAALPPEAGARLRADGLGDVRAASTPRPYLIEVTAGVLDGRLWLVWTHTPGIHATATVERLARDTLGRLRELWADSST